MSSNASINEAERQCDFWVFGGIFRPVYLEAVPNNFIEYTAIDARQHGELNADIFIDKKLSGIKAEIEIKDVQDQTMGKITSASIKRKKQEKYPYLAKSTISNPVSRRPTIVHRQ